MTQHLITFLPDETSIEVDEGTTIAEAAHEAEVHINNSCGGEGVCGECKVQVVKGVAEAEEQATALLSEEELDEGYVLACQTEIRDTLEILIPPESRMEEAQIMKGATPESTSETDGEPQETTPDADTIPIIRKLFLELPLPTLEDNISDIERVSRELRKKLGWHSFDISLDCLQHLSDTLRDHEWKVTATVAKDTGGYQILRVDPLDTTQHNYGVAIDVGTTTVVAQLVDIQSRKLLGVEGAHNMQASYGEDVISRMIYACGNGGLHPLHEAVIKNINHLIEKLATGHNISVDQIGSVVAAGNTTMSHFLLNLTPCSIRLEPYVPTARLYPQILGKDIGINISPSGILETLPSVASYVGGDIVAGVLSSGLPDHGEVRGLIDIGTNGEIAIGNEEWLVCCSASAGPAFEGGGTRCGMRATKGAIEKVEILDGKVAFQTIGKGAPRGICGSGLIDCIYELVRNHIIGSDGKFDTQMGDPRISEEDGIPHYILAHSKETESGDAIVITESDIDNLIKSKGAVFAAIKSLVDYIGLSVDQIDMFYVAGGFGSYLDISKAVAIGLLPDIPHERIEFIGNSSLTGARMCLFDEEAFEKCHIIAKSMTNIELSNYKPFMDEYIAALFLPHTERKLFPSVHY